LNSLKALENQKCDIELIRLVNHCHVSFLWILIWVLMISCLNH